MAEFKHDSHVPPQAWSQHTLSVQVSPLEHSLVAWQGSPPPAWLVHVPESQKKPGAQFPSTLQVLPHARLPLQVWKHSLSGSVLFAMALQLPEPFPQDSHVPLHAVPQQRPSGQKPLAQTPPDPQTSPSCSRQLPLPLQVLAPLHPVSSTS